MELGTLLRPDESSIDEMEYELRLASDAYLGFPHALWLEKHQDDPELSAFKALCGKFCCIHFPGLRLVDSVGHRHVPHHFSSFERWCVGFRWPGFDRRSLVARPRKWPLPL